MQQNIRKFFTTGVLLFVASGALAGGMSDTATEVDTPLLRPNPAAARKTEPTYSVSAGLDGEIYPFFANFASLQKPDDRQWAVISVKVSNSSEDSLRDRVAVKVPGWSDQEIQIVELGAGEVKTLRFAPTFLPRLYRNHELIAATADIAITDTTGKPIYSTTIPIRLRSVDDIYWGDQFKFAPFIASWVTPHDLNVEKLLASAKELAPGRRLPGYEDWKDAAEQEVSTTIQARAIFNAVKKSGVSYVKSSITFGGNSDWSQRVRMPSESLGESSANCIDASVVFASLFENLGMDPEVVLVPGHAYIGVKVAKDSQRYLFIDAALVGRFTFDAAVKSAEHGLAKFAPGEITNINIDEARDRGIFPLPNGD